MQHFDSPLGSVELTDERLGHILTFHPEVRPCIKHIVLTLAEPERMKPSRHDRDVRIFYRNITPGKRLAVVVKINRRHFILTAYITSRKQTR